jgi:membrane protein required for colicin V production
MNATDLALGAALILFTLRGFWRGFLRESFGLAALIVALAAAMRFTPAGEAEVLRHVRLPSPIPAGVAFVGIFVIVHACVNLTGAILDWAAGGNVVRRVNGIAGAVFGLAKGALVLAFALLFLHLFPVAGAVDGQIMRSTMGPPLIATATNLIRVGVRTTPSGDAGET